MLALTAEVGDVCVRTDLTRSFILKVAGASVLSHWQELLTPTDVVSSVAGKTGAVTLVKSDVGLSNVDNTSDANKPVSSATLSALNNKVDNTRVLTDVPVGALFTDTVYTHPSTHSADIIVDGTNNKAYTATEKAKLTGIADNANNYIHPTGAGNVHIPSGGAAGQFLKYSASGVAVWAADNDTIYTHPSSHSPSIITQDENNRFVTDVEKTTWNTVSTKPDLKTAVDTTVGAMKFNGSVKETGSFYSGTTNPTAANRLNFDGYLYASGLYIDTKTVATLDGSETLQNKTMFQSILSAPKMISAGSLNDSNGKELIKFPTSVVNAINEITITNSITGQPPHISASGDDANIDLHIESKGGSSKVFINGTAASVEGHTHSKMNITDFPTIPTDTNQLTKTDVYTKIEIDTKLEILAGLESAIAAIVGV